MRPQVSQSAFAERHEKVLRTPRARPDCAARRRALRALGGDVWPASCAGSCLACNAPGMRGILKCGPAAGVDMSHLSFTRIGHARALSGALSSLRHPDDLILRYGAGRGLGGRYADVRWHHAGDRRHPAGGSLRDGPARSGARPHLAPWLRHRGAAGDHVTAGTEVETGRGDAD